MHHQEDPIQKGSNRGIELQDNPPLVDGIVNFEAPNATFSVRDNMDLDKNVPIGQIFSTIVQQKVTSIGKILVILNRPLAATSNKTPVHCRATMICASYRTSTNIN
jgi:hypothetical protein